MKIFLLALILFLTGSALAQTDLPDKGSLSDIKGKTRVYISGDAINASYLTGELAKHKEFTNVSKADDADFVVEYHTINVEYVSSLQLPVETGQLDAFLYRDNRRVVVWSKGDVKGKRGPAAALLREFLKELAKAK
jgi:hypothetical protein